MRSKCAIILAFTGKNTEVAQENKYKSRTVLFEQISLIDIFGSPRVILVGRYDYVSTLREIQGELESRGVSECTSVVLDISCFTAVQLVFMIRWIHTVVRPKKCVVTYCRPREYGSEHSRALSRPGYQILPLPIRVRPRSAINEVRRVAVMVMGHEGIRSLTAWRAIDPMNTVLIFPTSGSSKFDKICDRRNSYLVGLSQNSGGFSTKIASTVELAKTREMLGPVLATWSAIPDIRVSLIPFGPKPLIVAATLAILDAESVDFELAYAIPNGYSGQYSIGAEAVYFEQIVIPNVI